MEQGQFRDLEGPGGGLGVGGRGGSKSCKQELMRAR